MNHFFDPAGKFKASPTNLGSASEAIEQAFQLHQIATEEVCVDAGKRIVVHTDPRSVGADRFRYLRMGLRELWNAGKLKTLLITSPLPRDGKSTIAMNLATALAEGGKRTVLLVEADLHKSTLTGQLGIAPGPGLAECLEDALNPVSAIRRLEPLGWYFLPAGTPHGNPTELLQTEALAAVIQNLSAHFDWVLFDSPPVTLLTDAVSLARQTNATMLVAREGHTPRETIEKAIALVGRQRVLGIILNAFEGLDRLYSGYYGYYGNAIDQGPTALGRPGTVRPKAIPAKSSPSDPKGT